MGQTSTEKLCQWETFCNQARITTHKRRWMGSAFDMLCPPYGWPLTSTAHMATTVTRLQETFTFSFLNREPGTSTVVELSWSSLFHYVIYRNKFLINTPVTPRQPVRCSWYQQAEIEFKYLSGDNLPGIKLIHGKLFPDRYLFPMITYWFQ